MYNFNFSSNCNGFFSLIWLCLNIQYICILFPLSLSVSETGSRKSSKRANFQICHPILMHLLLFFFGKIVNGLLMPNIHWVKQIIVSTLAFNIQFCSTFLCGHTVVAVVASWCALHSPLLAYSYIHVCCINLKNWWTFLLLISNFLEHYENENSK